MDTFSIQLSWPRKCRADHSPHAVSFEADLRRQWSHLSLWKRLEVGGGDRRGSGEKAVLSFLCPIVLL